MSPCCHENWCYGRVIENVINYDFYIKFPGIFVRNVQICATFGCRNVIDVAKYFEYYTIMLGALFRGHAVVNRQIGVRGFQICG